MRRWLLWNLRCLRGRRCAHLVVTVDAPKGISPFALPNPERFVVVGYRCGACGTYYENRGGDSRFRVPERAGV